MKIFIDPGHGGKDPGAIGIKGTRECDVVLGIALELRKLLEKAGVETVLSRESDKTLSLSERAGLANESRADLFISIHCNGFTNSGAKGTEVFAYNGDGKGVKLAGNILEEVCAELGTVNRGVKTENFAVLRLTAMTAVLIETAFITNAAEEEMMREAGFAAKMAGAVAKGIYKYGGISVNKAEHWGETHLKSLQEKGYINSPELWRDFEGVPTNAMVLALADKITEVIKNENTK